MVFPITGLNLATELTEVKKQILKENIIASVINASTNIVAENVTVVIDGSSISVTVQKRELSPFESISTVSSYLSNVQDDSGGIAQITSLAKQQLDVYRRDLLDISAAKVVVYENQPEPEPEPELAALTPEPEEIKNNNYSCRI